jgi:hypothetical protein
MDNEMKQNEVKRGRGRPPLSPEERELRRIENIKRSNEWHKASGYASKKKYKAKHPEKVTESNAVFRKNHNIITIFIPKELRPELDRTLLVTGLTITALFTNAVEEKYGIKLTKD